MVVCRFFLQGNCKFGNKCYNEHPSGENQGYSVTAQRQLFGGGGRNQNQASQRVGFRDSYGQNQNPYRWSAKDAQQQQQTFNNPQTATSLSPADIVKALAGEVTQVWEGGKIWPFSCLGFEKESPSLPGFQDLSYEEFRHRAYEARDNGTFEVYLQEVQAMFNENNIKRQELKNPNMTLRQSLISFIEDWRRKKQSSSGNQVSLFSDSNLFGGNSSGQQGLFGNNQSTFGQQSGSQSAFGQSGSSSLFGQSNNQPSFGQTGTQSGFGQTGSLFGNTQNIGQSGSPFGQNQGGFGQNTTGFGQTPSGFGQSPAGTSPFGQQPSSSSQTPQTPKANLFGGTTPIQSSPAQNVCGQSSGTATSSGFAAAPGTQQTLAPSSVAPSAAPSSSSASGTSSSSGSSTGSIYTPLNQLTAEELDQFKAPTFTVGLIPTRPPPRELCF